MFISNQKNILYIKNYDNNLKISNYYNSNEFNIEYILSINLINLDNDEINNLVKAYDIFIFGGGPQHITMPFVDIQIIYPEIYKQIQIINLIKNKYTNKLIIGICLGMQIIAKSFGININSKEVQSIGTNFLDLKSLNLSQIHNDIYLSKINFELLSKSFSFHYDCVDSKQLENSNDLIKIGSSIDKCPYIIKHKFLKIYGFQFHPEVNNNLINDVIEKFKLDKTIIDLDIKYIEQIPIHFFQIFL